MKEVEKVIKDIKNRKFKPIYFLMGDEPYYIDLITNTIESYALVEEEKAFNQTIIYGKDVSIDEVVSICRQYPMGAEYAVVIIKEAQLLDKNIEDLENYLSNIQPSTILVINYKGKTLDKRKKVSKLIFEKGVVLESKKLYDNQIPDWIQQKIEEEDLLIEPKAKFLLAEYLGSDLSKIENEINKLKINLNPKEIITCEIIEKYIGISKDYNNFEFLKAVGSFNKIKSFEIAKKFSENEKEYPMIVTLSLLFNLFANIITLHSLTDKSVKNIAQSLKINPFFVKDYQVAAQNFHIKKATATISYLREADGKKKGLYGTISNMAIYNELLFKIFC